MRPENRSRIQRNKLYWRIIKGRRSTKGNRWLSHLWPNTNEQKLTFRPRFAYLNNIGPGDIAGNHFHTSKKELFCPLGNLELLLADPVTNKITVIKITPGNKNSYTMYYIPPRVPHAVRNCTKKFQPLVVLTNTPDVYAKTYNYKVI
ncbi:MAG: cupin domain-containing protein [Patescibacteria group bacterium]|nr:cupin domain-containing protein [Patescibacteria group bacterium]